MKTAFRTSVISSLLLVGGVGATYAQTYTVPASGSFLWDKLATWSPATQYPDGIGVVVKKDQGDEVLTLTQNINGGVTVGSLILEGESKRWQIVASRTITLNEDGVGSGHATIRNSSSSSAGQLLVSGTLVLADDLLISNDSAVTLLGALQMTSLLLGNGNITISNIGNSLAAGHIQINASNTFTGNVLIAKGVTTFNNASSFGGVAGNTITLGQAGQGDATLVFTNPSGTVRNNIVVAADTGGKLLLGSTNAVTASLVTYGGSLKLDGDLDVTSSHLGTGRVSYTGVISGSGKLNVTGAGNTRISGSNSFTGETRIQSGNLALDAETGTEAYGLQNSTLNLDGNDTGTLSFGASTSTTINAATIGGLKGSRDLVLNNANASPEAVVLKVGRNNADTIYSGVLSGAGALVKSGTGELTLEAVNTYSGTTKVEGGTLRVASTGRISDSSMITVEAGAELSYNSSVARTGATVLNGAVGNRAKLSGEGVFDGALTLDDLGDTLSPGDGVGSMAFSVGQEWEAFTYFWHIVNFTGTVEGDDFSQIAINGALTLGGAKGAYVLDLATLPAELLDFEETNRSWVILTTTDGITGFDADDWSITGYGDTSGVWSLAVLNDDLVLNYAAVPEPGTWVIFALGAAAVILRRKTSKKSDVG